MKKWKIRKLNADDIAYITSTWMNSYRANNEFPRDMKHRIFSSEHNRIINSILIKANTLVACDPEDEGHIFGYVVTSEKDLGLDIVHYLYVKAPFQRKGIGKDLIAEAKKTNKVVYTHKNQKAKWIVDKLLSEYEVRNYNPYLFFKEI